MILCSLFSGLPDNLSPRPFSPTPTFGYICGPSEVEEMGERGGPQRGVSGRARLRSTPSSCCSEWEGSLWNAWGSVSEGNMPSARTSLISSSDCSFMNDANFARVLALTAESMTGANLSGKRSCLHPYSTLLSCQTAVVFSVVHVYNVVVLHRLLSVG